MLKGGAVYPDVVDSNGHSPLFVAAVSFMISIVLYNARYYST